MEKSQCVSLSVWVLGCMAIGSFGFAQAPPYGHLHFKRWKRSAQCCSADGQTTDGKSLVQVGISSGGEASSRCGADILAQGGSLADAAIATAACLAVERPQSAGLGGGMFFLLHQVDKQADKQPVTSGDTFWDCRETAPLQSKLSSYRSSQNPKGTLTSLDGIGGVGTPGFVACLQAVHDKAGRLPLEQLLRPAIALARKGFLLYPTLRDAIKTRRKLLKRDPTLRALFFNHGRVPEIGFRIRQADLARTLEELGKDSKSFYTGRIAADIVKTSQAQKGVLIAEDLAQYKVRVRPVLKASWRGFEVATAPLPSSGGLLLVQTLRVVDVLEFNEKTPLAYFLHGLAESFVASFAMRNQTMGDPDFLTDHSYERVLSPDFIREIADHVRRKEYRPMAMSDLGRARPESLETTHLSLLDSLGNAVSATMTLNYLFGSGIAVPGRGIILNDEIDDFSFEHAPNVYGLTGGRGNEMQPQKRPLSSMTPTLFSQQGKAVLVLGAPGGSWIPTAVTQVALGVLVRQLDLKGAIFGARIHHQGHPNTLYLEQSGLPAEVISQLKKMGYPLTRAADAALVEGVVRRDNGSLLAVFDPRSEGGAEVVRLPLRHK